MKKQILVIGGSYFTGRVFTTLSSRGDSLQLHVVNRGRFPLNLPNVTEYICDRHNSEKLLSLLPDDVVFDAVVDFCAYEPGDISSLLKALSGRVRQYVFFSTSSVYAQGDGEPKTEDSPLRSFSGDNTVDKYILNKSLLEDELQKTCEDSAVRFTIFRPAFIYGPFNYAPRESYYIEKIVRRFPVPVVTDSHSQFSFVYVTDISRALDAVIGNEKAYDSIFNLAGDEVLDYAAYDRVLAQCSEIPYTAQEMTVSEVLDKNVPVPFPLNENEVCSGKQFALTFDFRYTPFAEGMEKTFKVFKNVFSS